MAGQQQTKIKINGKSISVSAALLLITVFARSARKFNWKPYAGDILALARDGGRIGARAIEPIFGIRAKIIYLALILASFCLATFSAISIAFDTMHKYAPDISSPATIMNKKSVGTTITDRNGIVLYQGFGATDRHNIAPNEMPQHFIDATIATEDPDFYKHKGVSLRATARAVYQDIKHSEKIQGGSTITQQLVKTTLLSSEKSFIRKYKEILLALELERRYSKDQIMQMYINTIYYGQGSYGVTAASKTYFGKDPKDLTISESALLAGLAQSPSRYDPNVNRAAAKERRDYVLQRMEELGYIANSTAQKAQAEPVETGVRQIVIKAPHFVFYVLDQLRRDYGAGIVENGGITVKTSLDYNKQLMGEEAVRNQISRISDKHNATNGGLVSMDPKTGDILAMVGSVNYNEPNFGSVNVTLAQLQPGSSFKPITYVTAFSKGWNGAVKVDDKPISFPQDDGTAYVPKNYDGKFRGPVLLRRALANSLNIPAIEVQKFAGLDETITMAHRLGITTPSLEDKNRLGLSLVLGGGEVRPIDMATVYSTFANQGTRIDPRAVLEVKDRLGKDITQNKKIIKRNVLDPRLAYMITNILSDNNTRSEIFGPRSPLVLTRPAAVKTGTTNDWRDNWTVGYTPNLVTAVWVGNNDHSAMYDIDGITGAAPIWNQFMERALASMPVEQFDQPAGLVRLKVCKGDGGLAPSNSPDSVDELFLEEVKPTKPCGASTKKDTIRQIKPPDKQNPPIQQAQAPIQTGEPGRGGGGGDTPPAPAPAPDPAPAPEPPIPPQRPRDLPLP